MVKSTPEKNVGCPNWCHLCPESPSILKEEQNQPINSSWFHEGLLDNILGNSCLLHTPETPKKRNRKPVETEIKMDEFPKE